MIKIIEELYKYLKEEGYSVYFPAQPIRDGDSNYVTISEGMSTSVSNYSRNTSVNIQLTHDISQYTEFLKEKARLLERLKNFSFLTYDSESDVIISDDNNNYIVIFEFSTLKANTKIG